MKPLIIIVLCSVALAGDALAVTEAETLRREIAAIRAEVAAGTEAKGLRREIDALRLENQRLRTRLKRAGINPSIPRATTRPSSTLEKQITDYLSKKRDRTEIQNAAAYARLSTAIASGLKEMPYAVSTVIFDNKHTASIQATPCESPHGLHPAILRLTISVSKAQAMKISKLDKLIISGRFTMLGAAKNRYTRRRAKKVRVLNVLGPIYYKAADNPQRHNLGQVSVRPGYSVTLSGKRVAVASLGKTLHLTPSSIASPVAP